MQNSRCAVFSQTSGSRHVWDISIAVARQLLSLVLIGHVVSILPASRLHESFRVRQGALGRSPERSSDYFVTPSYLEEGFDYFVAPTAASNYDCSGKGTFRVRGKHKAVKEAIEAAKKILEKCDSCRNIFKGNPIKRLDELVRIKAIVVSKMIPTKMYRDPGTEVITASRPGEFPKDSPAMTIDLTGRLPEVGPRQCIYIKASSFVVEDKPNMPVPYGMKNIADARALVILHELGHVMDSIQNDSSSPAGIKKGTDSNECIKSNCFPCATDFTPCPGVKRQGHHDERISQDNPLSCDLSKQLFMQLLMSRN